MDIIRMDLLALVAFLGIAKIVHVIFKLTFWRRIGVKGPVPIPIFGNWLQVNLGRQHSAKLAKSFYDQYESEPMVGVYQNHTPILILRDMNIIRDVLITDFNSCSGRGVYVHEKFEPLNHHLFTMKHGIWQVIKKTVSPVFDMTKIKDHCDTIWRIAEGLPGNSTKTMTRFMNKVIGKRGFQLDMNEFGTEKTAFQRITEDRHTSSIYNSSRRLLRENFPGIYGYCFKIFRNDAVIAYYKKKLKFIEKFRKCQRVDRKDYTGLLLELKNGVKIGDRHQSDGLLRAQIYLLFTAGAESTALVISKAICEIAKCHSIQTIFREEITKVFEANGETRIFKKIEYLKHLDSVIKETLRKYPLIKKIIRASTGSYSFRDTNVEIPKGIHIIVPLYGLHHDPEIFPDPTNFNHGRFDEKMQNENGFIIPLGLGPKYCIGAKLAKIAIKIIITVVVKTFKLSIDEGYTLSRNHERKKFLEPEKGITVKFAKYTR